MCGIIGYVGKKNAVPVIIDGLKKLEYRGYDSSGIAVYSDDCIVIEKSKGNLSNLENKIEGKDLYSNIGIGHTRWATHGAPSDINAHPHTNSKNTIAIIHNGIIENYIKLKDFLENECKINLISETDTELIAHLIDYYFEGDIIEAVYKTVERLEGTFTLGIISKSEPEKLIAVRKDSPLIVGIGENENFISSDIPAILKHTRDIILIENDEFLEITKDDVKIYDKFKNPIERKPFKVTWDIESAEKEGFSHFTLKEIYEQPKSFSNTLNHHLLDGKINIDNLNITKEELESFTRIYIVGCGTAYNAGLIGKYAFRKFANIDVVCDISSEFRYNDSTIDNKTLVICISQSGETLDTLQSLRLAKNKGAKILSIVNIVGSSITRESDYVFYTLGGPEIGVASTKIFTCQLLSLYLISLKFGQLLGKIDDNELKTNIDELKTIPNKIQSILDKHEDIKKIALSQYNNDCIFFMGRNIDMEIAYESSLKLKELSYLNCFAIGAGELKHGTISLINEDTFIITIATQKRLFDKILSNVKEVKARGANVLIVVNEDAENVESYSEDILRIPNTFDIFTPILSIIPMQLLAYYIATNRGNDVDKPRNLAKSVTVE